MIILDYQDRRPLYEQIVDKLKELVYRGILEEHEQLPSVRSLAMELSINPNTIQRAYAELERSTIIYSVKGKGSFVAPSQTIRENKEKEVDKQLIKLIAVAKSINISAESLIQKVVQYYDKGEVNDDRSSESNQTI